MENNLKFISNSVPDNKLPAIVIEASEFLTAANNLLENITNESAVDLETVNLNNIKKVLEAAAAYTRDHTHREEHARSIVTIASNRLEAAWRDAVHPLESYFAEQFNKAAATLGKELATITSDPQVLAAENYNPAGATLRETLDTLAQLSKVRDAYASLGGPLNLYSNAFEKATRTARFTGAKTQHALHERYAVRGGNYYIHAAQHDGVTLTWQTRTEQLTNPIRQEDDATTRATTTL